jgi:hypothetical protein
MIQADLFEDIDEALDVLVAHAFIWEWLESRADPLLRVTQLRKQNGSSSDDHTERHGLILEDQSGK